MADRDHEKALKRELDALRLENQELHSALRRFDDPRFVLGKLSAAVSRRLRCAVLKVLRRRAHMWQPDPSNFAPTFRAYSARAPAASTAARRVVHAIGNFYTGGSPRLVVDLVEGLGESFSHIAVAREAPTQPHFTGLELQTVPEFGGRRNALRLLRRLRPDLIHVHFLGHHEDRHGRADWVWYDDLFHAAAEYGCPVIENVNIPVVPYFSEAVDCYVFVSDDVRRRFGRDRDRNLTIYPGSDVDRFSRRAGSLPPDNCVGMVYRLERDKLDERAIDVFVEVLRRRADVEALIVGGGRFLEPYRERVESAGLADGFTFTGYVAYDDLPDLYEQMSIFVAPPHTESFGHVVPLAMSMSTPVAAYAVGALPEILGDDDLLTPAGDVDALAAKIVELLDDRDRRLEIGAANRQRARRLFSVEKMVADYRVLYEELFP
jgi:glycosyltransferase involved in cell wall biosynthesis